MGIHVFLNFWRHLNDVKFPRFFLKKCASLLRKVTPLWGGDGAPLKKVHHPYPRVRSPFLRRRRFPSPRKWNHSPGCEKSVNFHTKNVKIHIFSNKLFEKVHFLVLKPMEPCWVSAYAKKKYSFSAKMSYNLGARPDYTRILPRQNWFCKVQKRT